MNFEKLVNSRINAVADWIIRLVVLNVLIIATSLPIITFYPSLVAGYKMFNNYVEQRNTRLYHDYFGYLKVNILKNIGISIIILLAAVLAYLNLGYYGGTEAQSIMTQIGFYITIMLISAIYAMILFSIIVKSVKQTISFTSLVKLSFYLAGKHFFVTILSIFIYSIPFILFLIPQLVVVYVICGLSLPITLHVLISRHVRHYLVDLNTRGE